MSWLWLVLSLVLFLDPAGPTAPPAVAADPALPNVRTYGCASERGGILNTRVIIDYTRSVVRWDPPQYGAPPEAPAQISRTHVVWERPRYTDNAGTVILRQRYAFDRYTAVIATDNYCEPSDGDWCYGAGTLLYCQPISGAPPY